MESLNRLKSAQPSELSVEDVKVAVRAWKDGDDAVRLDAIRLMRNACAGGAHVQTYLLVDELETVMDAVCEEIEEMSVALTEEAVVGFRCRLQLVHNAYASRDDEVRRDRARLSRVARAALAQTADSKARNVACSLVLALAKALEPDGDLDLGDADTIARVLREASAGSSFALLALSCLTERWPRAVASSYPSVPAAEQTVLLEFLKDFQTEKEIPDCLMNSLLNRFKQLTKTILVAGKSVSPAENPAELLALLDLFGDLTSTLEDRGDISTVRADKSLLVESVYLLRMLHDAGRAEGSDFAPVSKAADVLDGEVDVEGSPAFGMKRALVRLVGNLCWENEAFQDEVREMDGIPLLLECTGLDAKNPVMMQWAIFALRNLCRGNAANQAVLAAVDDKGVAVRTLEEEFGVRVVEKGRGNAVQDAKK